MVFGSLILGDRVPGTIRRRLLGYRRELWRAVLGGTDVGMPMSICKSRLSDRHMHARRPLLLWLGTMMAQIFVKGFRADILRRMLCFNLFWHVLDIIWVALFTIVYLIGEGR
jgi:hypothetical protein